MPIPVKIRLAAETQGNKALLAWLDENVRLPHLGFLEGGDASGGPVSVPFPSALAGDKVCNIVDPNLGADVTASFEAVVSVDGMIVQTSGNMVGVGLIGLVAR